MTDDLGIVTRGAKCVALAAIRGDGVKHAATEKLSHKGRAALEQIQMSLGCTSMNTMKRYLGNRQDLQNALFIFFELSIGQIRLYIYAR